MPKPLEKERKFLVRRCDLTGIVTTTSVGITQTYLRSEPDVERRVRARNHHGAESYFYTEKRPTEDPRVRHENERMITRREYEQLLREADPAFRVIRKMRTTFVFQGRHLELDVYQEPLGSLVILEVEVENLDDEIRMPPGFDVVEVTNDLCYRNAAIARGSLNR